MTQLASVANNLKVWTWEDGSAELALKSTFRAPASPVNCAAWNHTNQVIALGGKEPKIHLVQANNGQQLSSLLLSESKLSQFKVSAVAFSHHSRFIATSIDTPVQMWDLKKRQIISIFTGHKQPIVSLDFNTNSDVFAADGSGNTCLWSIKSPTPNNPLQTYTDSISEASFTLTCMKLSLNGQYIASGFENGSVKLWETSSMSGEVYRTMTGHSNRVSALSWSPKNTRLLATVSTDEKLKLIDINANPGAAGKGICAEVNVEQRCASVSFHENGVHTAVGTMDGGIILYDWRNTRKPVFVMNCHNPFPVNALCFQVSNLLLFITHF
jgi:WD40 repeat protein